MMFKLLIFIFITLYLSAEEYEFDISELKPDPYEYSGYLRLDNKFQKINDEKNEYQNHLHSEALFDSFYYYKKLTFKTSIMATYDHIEDKLQENDTTLNELYIEAKLNTNHTLLVGKESLRWGKGYYFNPVAFFDRPKDPVQPTQTREGFIVTKYNYNKSFSGNLKNISFDAVYLPSRRDINEDYNSLNTDKKNSNNLAMRLYLLLYDTDIDFIYNYSDVLQDKIGIDFSKNIQVNFELHGEFAKVIDGECSYLFGVRYLSDFELTIISEYLYNSDGLSKDEIKTQPYTAPFSAKDYLVTSFTQKEPFSWLYSTLYYKNTMNLEDSSWQNKFGGSYSFKNNIDVDLSFNKNSGVDLSEFGKKIISDFIWLQIIWKY